jgi:glycosyltransferase involved in cell wall biosynthesis
MTIKKKPIISAVINTLNEESNIDACLRALQWCDEIIVVDMESDDSTTTIALQYTNKIFSFKRVGCVEPARSFAVSQATGDWILIVDADELIKYSLSEKLVKVASEDQCEVVNIPFKTYIFGEWICHTGWWPEYHPRFFKKGFVDFSDQIHSAFLIKQEARRFHLPPNAENAIEHFAYNDITQFIGKLNRYTTIEASHLYNNKTKFSCYKMFWNGLNEFVIRYLRLKGYKDGFRGLFLSIIMCVYRIISHMKLWEMFENERDNVSERYTRYKNELIDKHQQHK